MTTPAPLVLAHAPVPPGHCEVVWVDGDRSHRAVVAMPAEVCGSPTVRGFRRRRTAFQRGYIACRRGQHRLTNPHQGGVIGFVAPLARCWYLGFDAARASVSH